MIESGARERNQSREEGVERALSRPCLLSRARVTRVLTERLLRRIIVQLHVPVSARDVRSSDYR